ncbi:MAG: GGDEF domain-containing protein [Mycobacteriaceae bacterium]|nr:GGDEF domain-containing protein [Mycobacteriaceae bacterium]
MVAPPPDRNIENADRSLVRQWWNDRLDYRVVVATLTSYGALGWAKRLLTFGGVVMVAVALIAMRAQHGLTGDPGPAQGLLEAGLAGVWTLRWWLLPWPRKAESLLWVVGFDLDAVANAVLVQDRVIGVLGLALMATMGAYVAVFHSPRVLAAHIAWSVLTSAVLATALVMRAAGAEDPGRDAAVGAAIVLVMVVVIAMPLLLMQFSGWVLRRDALSDPLTQVLNRRGLDTYLPGHFHRHECARVYFATVDLDQFKSINDAHGHHVGDEALVHTARRLRETVEPDALVARTGGEEFVVVGCLREDAAAVGERLRAQVSAIPGFPFTITVSVGIAAIDTPRLLADDSRERDRELLRASDLAMYQAKNRGGNAVVVAGPP